MKTFVTTICATILLAACSVSAAPEDAIPTNLNEILNQATGAAGSILNDPAFLASADDAASLLNDPAFLASASDALKSLNGFLSSNPDLLSSALQDYSLPTPIAGDDEESGTDKDAHFSSGASSIRLFTGAAAAIGLTALSALF
ncbi:hypothetical protein LPJ57_001835 [Coemansia sp. RSA 486]|nr:hypothetical protein LPJ57_001835 [Coemansia sp. RSA 486]KAJ2234972.1 hypothetical protein IWW45_002978 [Coemansia sp. RSA 485]KAJ2638764.1 hypothetical protein GGF40_001423 [Coemansia sp. RSA 1286]